ncbi:MAG: 3-carboxy-cis,cis-muconate cycloisomerase [Pseudomonadota bacterium]
MAVSPFDSTLYGGLYGDPEIAPLFTDASALRAMMRVEAALARAQAGLGMIPQAAAEAIGTAAETARLDPAALATGTAQDGVPVPALVTAFRAALPEEAAAWLHFGATSQDILDTALILQLRAMLEVLEARLERLIAALADQAEAHRGTVMAARTRAQIATPTLLGARIAVWGAPILRQRDRLAELRPRLLQASLAGASGTLASMGPQGPAVARAMAAALHLGAEPIPWNAARDSLAELGGWLSLLTGALGKIGADLILLGQTELREAQAGAAGGSSTMPHKTNPVGPETLVALARAAPGHLATLHQALIHTGDRDGAAWAAEWQALPPLCLSAGAATRHGLALIETLRADPARMARSMDDTQGLMMAEAASFALAAYMPRPEAQALVKSACQDAAAGSTPLDKILAAKTDAPLDWDAVFDPARYTGMAAEIVEAFLAKCRKG